MKSGPAGNIVTPYDVKLLFPVLFLVGIGIVMVYSASSALALKNYGTDLYFLKKQGVFALGGILVLVTFTHLPYRLLRLLSYPLLAASLGLLAAVHVDGLGYAAGGSTRWLRVAGVSFQPSEFARFAMIVYLSFSLSRKLTQIKDFSVGFLPHVLVLSLFALLIASQPDFGSVVLLVAVTWIMLFVGGVRIVHLLSLLVVAVPAGYYFMVHAAYRLRRLKSFLDPWQYQADEGYQITHSLMAFGTGGIWGTGIGKGYQKLFYLPEPHTDFIFSVIGEELGLVGVLFVLSLYALVLWRGISIARNARDPFGAFLATGLTTALGLQVCVNMGVTLSLLPTKGLTLPFLSYGGTSLLVSMASVGILMNIGAHRGAAWAPVTKPGAPGGKN